MTENQTDEINKLREVYTLLNQVSEKLKPENFNIPELQNIRATIAMITKVSKDYMTSELTQYKNKIK